MVLNHIDFRVISSLEKVFPDTDLVAREYLNGSALREEVYSFQVAYRNRGSLLRNLQASVASSLDHCTVRSVGLVPSELPCYEDHDSEALRFTPGLYPDPLYTEEDATIAAPQDQWRSLWISAKISADAPEGEHLIRVQLALESGEVLFTAEHTLTVIPYGLQVQRLLRTEWLHTDCLSDLYKVEVFSEEYWELVKVYVKNAAENGINMIYTPLFTPPLDTAPGQERPTVQLVSVKREERGYQFHFDRLKRWVRLCQSQGITHFEFSHLFTQWGAAFTPKIIVYEKGQAVRKFGWDVSSDNTAYEEFLEAFLPALIQFIQHEGLEGHVYFHVSDEPDAKDVESYARSAELLKSRIQNLPVLDALSDPDFFDKGLVEYPVIASDHYHHFSDRALKERWIYYCCKQYQKVSNRFMHMSSSRNRIIGLQMYNEKIEGFLHWGYNFWYSRFSTKVINPFICTDADRGFPSGDAFLVYPGSSGPIESIRMLVFREAMQDMRALQTLETLIGRENVEVFIKEQWEGRLSLEDSFYEPNQILHFRYMINQKISKVAKDMKKKVKS